MTGSPILSALVDGDPLASEITLTNGLSIMCFPCTLRSMRGFSIPAAVMDEVAFFRLEGQADSDVEIQTSIRRGMIGFETTRLVKISTPYMRSGVLHDDFARAFGKPDPDLLVWRATSALMNPKLTDARLSREQRLDPQRFAREYLAEFADDVMAFLPQAWIDAAVVQGRHELPPREGLRYMLAVDPSGGGADAFTVSVVHAEGTGADLRVVQDLLKGWGARRSGQVDLEGIVAEVAQIARRYGVRTVHGDRYSRDWVAQAFGRHGLRYDSDHGLDKTAAYLEAEPLFAQGRIAILDDATQRRELVCLERRPRPGNKATVDHPNNAGAHDDYANALALAAAVASKKPGRPMFAGWGERAKREEQKPSTPPASELYVLGIDLSRFRRGLRDVAGRGAAGVGALLLDAQGVRRPEARGPVDREGALPLSPLCATLDLAWRAASRPLCVARNAELSSRVRHSREHQPMEGTDGYFERDGRRPPGSRHGGIRCSRVLPGIVAETAPAEPHETAPP